MLTKISKIGTTKCQILRLKCTKFDFLWDSAPDPAGGAYRAPPNSEQCAVLGSSRCCYNLLFYRIFF